MKVNKKRPGLAHFFNNDLIKDYSNSQSVVLGCLPSYLPTKIRNKNFTNEASKLGRRRVSTLNKQANKIVSKLFLFDQMLTKKFFKISFVHFPFFVFFFFGALNRKASSSLELQIIAAAQHNTTPLLMKTAIAQWIHLHLASFIFCRPGFESQVHHLRFFMTYLIVATTTICH